MYCKVENNQVVGVFVHLPASYGNISGFGLLSPAERAAHGIFDLEEIRPALTFTLVDDGDVDGDGNPVLRQVPTQTHGEPTDEILADRVVRTYLVLERPAADIRAATNAPIQKKIEAIEARQQRAVREAALGVPGAVARLQATENQIAALRSMLV